MYLTATSPVPSEVEGGDELALAALLFATAAPGTTGPALIFTSRAETDTGAFTGAVVVLVSPVTDVSCPATGKLVSPAGVTETAGAAKKQKYAAAPIARTAMTIA